MHRTQPGTLTGKGTMISGWIQHVMNSLVISTGLQVTNLINYAMKTCLTGAWHSSYPWSTTQSARRWGDSMVVLLDRAGHSFPGKLRAALTHSARWPAGQRIFGFIQRTEHHTERPDDYEYLQALAEHEIPL